MTESYIAAAEIDIDGAPTAVWKALTDPELVAKYFFGTQVQTDWKPGSPIVWKGEYEGKKYEDKGEILEVQPNRLLRVTHFSPMIGLADKPENYHTLTYDLDERGGSTHVTLSQDNNSSEEEAERSTANWETVLTGLKKTVENA